jgi:putative NADH-flavin reductase
MRLAVFGATGRAGRVVIEQALRNGHHVSALARDPAQIRSPAQIRPHGQSRPPVPVRPPGRLRVVGGDVRDPVAVARVLDGADAIISALGRRRRGPDVCTEGMRTVLAGGGPRRLLVLSNYGVADSRHHTAYVAVSWLLERAVLRDKDMMEALVRDSDADWTVVRPPVLTDGPRTGRYRTGAGLRLSFADRLSRADLAEFLLAELHENAYVRQAVAITTVRGRRSAGPRLAA